jgi:hypothetical protein
MLDYGAERFLHTHPGEMFLLVYANSRVAVAGTIITPYLYYLRSHGGTWL